MTYIPRTVEIPFTIDGGGGVIQAGAKGYVRIPVTGKIIASRLFADVTGSIVLTISKGSYTDFPTVTSIVAAAKPTLAAAQKSEDTTLTGWTVDVTAGDILAWAVDSATDVTRVLAALTILMKGYN